MLLMGFHSLAALEGASTPRRCGIGGGWEREVEKAEEEEAAFCLYNLRHWDKRAMTCRGSVTIYAVHVTYAGNAFVTCNLGIFRVANCETVKEDALQLKL